MTKTKNLKSWKRYEVAGIPLNELAIKTAYFLILLIAVPLMFPRERALKYTDLNLNTVVDKDIIAPFDFPVLKEDKVLEAEREAARNDVPYYFNYNDTIVTHQLSKVASFLNALKSVPRTLNLPLQSTNLDSTAQLFIQNVTKTTPVTLSAEQLNQLIRLSRQRQFRDIEKTLIQLVRNLGKIKYIDMDKKSITNGKLVFREGGIESDAQMHTIYDHAEIDSLVANQFQSYQASGLLQQILRNFMVPNTYFNASLTEENRDEAEHSVALSKNVIIKDEKIIGKNERITPEIAQILYSLEFAITEKSGERGGLKIFLSRVGKFFLTGLILVLYVIYLSANRYKIFRDNKKLLLITILILIQMSIAALMNFFLSQSPFLIYLIPTTISSMLLAILFDSGVGVVGTMIIALLLGSHMEFNFLFTTLILIVGIVAIYSVTHMRVRNHIFKAIFYILLAYLLTIFSFGMLRFDEFHELFETFLYIIPNAILSGFITYMTLGIFERAFDITTDITLLELSDLNHPLLKELTRRAPGSFHHSIIVGNLAEAGAKAINANPLLARVGSYYHDIGKMNKPEYFIENQKGNENRHDTLAPNMSALILSTHVKEGIEMAEENKLPKLIRDFIPEHHGTSLMKYFYDRATKLKDSKEINEADYRYPGPRPQSKETAIVMLADTVEAATRTVKNPSPSRVRKLVEDLVEEKFLSGELDDSALTMRDLKSIIDGFMSVLLGIYHERIEYPEAKKRSAKNGN
jgi:putative nucleotidyltransferase with HDIG domain